MWTVGLKADYLNVKVDGTHRNRCGFKVPWLLSVPEPN